MNDSHEKEQNTITPPMKWLLLVAIGGSLILICSQLISIEFVLQGSSSIVSPTQPRMAISFTASPPETATANPVHAAESVTASHHQQAVQSISTSTVQPTKSNNSAPTPTDQPTSVATNTLAPTNQSTGIPTATLVPTPQRVESPTNAPMATLSLAKPQPGSVVQRVDSLLAEMTLEEKVGQLFLVFFVGPDLSPALKEMINEYHVGGILLFTVSDNIRSLSQVAQLINAAQSEAMSHGAEIPLFVAIDQEGGPIVRLTQGATIFPSNMAVGATESIENARLMAQVTATELKALGINMNLAPVMDVNNNPDNPIIGVRSFGSSPDQVAELGQAMIETYQANGIIATAKHFPGHGDTAVDSHVGLPVIPHELAHLEAVELVPFQAAIDTGVSAIMTAHLLLPAVEPTQGLPATLSPKVLQGLLREQMGFQGLIVTDSLGMGALDRTFGVTKAARLAFQAGADILAFGADPGHTPAEQRPAYNRILELIKSGDIPESRLDESVRRILVTKAKYGLLDWQPVNVDEISNKVGVDRHRMAARKIARDSITLVRDDQGLLPIEPEQSVLVIWPRGTGNLGGSLRAHHTNLQILRVSLDPSPYEIELVTQSAEVTSVVVVGTVNARRHPGQVQLINALANRPVIVVALGVPYDLISFPDVTTYLATYGDVPVSLDALAQVLFGRAKPKGHLPVDLPGLYSLGHGMTDTSATLSTSFVKK